MKQLVIWLVTKFAHKRTGVSNKKPTKELHNNDGTEERTEITTHKKDTYHQMKDNKLLMN